MTMKQAEEAQLKGVQQTYGRGSCEAQVILLGQVEFKKKQTTEGDKNLQKIKFKVVE